MTKWNGLQGKHVVELASLFIYTVNTATRAMEHGMLCSIHRHSV